VREGSTADSRHLLGDAADAPTAEEDFTGQDTHHAPPWQLTSEEFLDGVVISRVDQWEEPLSHPTPDAEP
jgi:hypothetical protein